ncbi:unknown [Mycoplasma sp. CAG:877]|nr:unknown [Mycoplasma sp. CAG:877]
MNKIKNIIYALVVVFILTATLDVHALTLGAIKGTTDPNSYIVIETATLTINKVSSSDSFDAYKIIDVFYNTTTNVITYEFTSDFKTFLAQSDVYKSLTLTDYYNLTSGNITSGSTQTSSTLDKLVSKYASYKGN